MEGGRGKRSGGMEGWKGRRNAGMREVEAGGVWWNYGRQS